MFYYVIYRFTLIFAKLIPYKFFHKLAVIFLKALFFFLKARRKKAFNNLSYFISQSPSKNFIKTSYLNWLQYYVEVMGLAAGKIDKIIQKNLSNIKIEGFNYLKSAAEEKKGVIISTLHIGNWDIGGAIIKRLLPEYNFWVLAERLNLPFLSQFYSNLRKNLGLSVVLQGEGSIQKLISALHRGDLVAILIDRIPGEIKKSKLLKIELLNQEFYISNILLVLGKKSKSPIIFSILIRDSPHYFKLVFFPPFYIEDVAEATKLIQNYLNMIIKDYIEQWYFPWQA